MHWFYWKRAKERVMDDDKVEKINSEEPRRRIDKELLDSSSLWRVHLTPGWDLAVWLLRPFAFSLLNKDSVCHSLNYGLSC